MTSDTRATYEGLSEEHYQRRIRAWTMYDWANSAFATTILAAVLPIYYSEVAGATLPSPAAATALWSLGLSISLFLIAIVSPILGTISDIRRNKKPFLSVFLTFGILATGLLVLISSGDWILASILFIVGRLGFTGANVFYDALLPHVARPEDRDRVSTRGYAMGYLGGGILLAINVAMIQVWGGMWGSRISFLSVAIWWAVFSIPLFRQIPEPPTATQKLGPKETVLSASFRRLATTFKDMRQYRELFKFLIAFLIYNDGIGTIIGVAAIYGAELGFGATELTLALLLVQFVGIPFSLIFGRIPSPAEKRRPQFLAFVVYNIIMLPLVGSLGLQLFPETTTGAQPAPFSSIGSAIGEGTYLVGSEGLDFSPGFQTKVVSADQASGGTFFEFINQIFGEEVGDVSYMRASEAGAALELQFNGQEVLVTYGKGPDHGQWLVELDGKAVAEEDGQPYVVEGYSDVVRYGAQSDTLATDEPGLHTLRLVNSTANHPQSSGNVMSIAKIEILQPRRSSSLPTILGVILGVELLGGIFALTLGTLFFSKIASTLTTKRSIQIALLTYAIIAVWGFFLNSTIEFWFLAWMVAMVQGGSQALSRSLYSSMSPATKSGEFFGLFGVMEKFSAILGPILFAAAGAIFASSRPAILSIIAFFIVGGLILNFVKVDDGIRVAKAEDQAMRESPNAS